MTEGEQEGYTPDQLEAEKSRTISDAELLKGGAEYVQTKPGEKILVVIPEQVEEIYDEFNLEDFREAQTEVERYISGDMTNEKMQSSRERIFTLLERVNDVRLGKEQRTMAEPRGTFRIKLLERSKDGKFEYVHWAPEKDANEIKISSTENLEDSKCVTVSEIYLRKEKGHDIETRDLGGLIFIPYERLEKLGWKRE